MKVELIKHLFDCDVGYKILTYDECCKKISDCPAIDVFINEYEEPIVAIHTSEHIYSWGDEYDIDHLYKINCCPFCSKKIEISIVREEDVTNEYFSLKQKRNELWDKYYNTDSMKKREELYKEVVDLDKKINWYHTLCMYDTELK